MKSLLRSGMINSAILGFMFGIQGVAALSTGSPIIGAVSLIAAGFQIRDAVKFNDAMKEI